MKIVRKTLDKYLANCVMRKTMDSYHADRVIRKTLGGYLAVLDIKGLNPVRTESYVYIIQIFFTTHSLVLLSYSWLWPLENFPIQSIGQQKTFILFNMEAIVQTFAQCKEENRVYIPLVAEAMCIDMRFMKALLIYDIACLCDFCHSWISYCWRSCRYHIRIRSWGCRYAISRLDWLTFLTFFRRSHWTRCC